MAEYTIPKPYRDFYVTNPYIELKESNERLQRIVKSGYVATDSFEGSGNQVITFDSPKHGFSLTNDSSKASSWSMDLNNQSYWQSGAISSTTGIDYDDTTRIRTNIYIPVIPGATYSISVTSTSGTAYSIAPQLYDESKKHYNTESATWLSLPATLTPTETSSTARFIRLVLSKSDNTDITPTGFIADISALKISVSAYTAPSDVTVKVSGITNDLYNVSSWEQGSLNASDGNQTTHSRAIRSSNFIFVQPSMFYYFKYLKNTSSTTEIRIFEYQNDGTFIQSVGIPVNSEYHPSKNTGKILIRIVYGASGDTFSPEDFMQSFGYFFIYGDLMHVTENDTRIVTMPPFTSLYIESNVPYHGHALDLAE